MFDKISISVVAGKGGNGCISFKREKYVPFGGPDGGNGGNGGSVYIEVDSHVDSLIKLSHRSIFKAEDGLNGSPKNRFGKCGKDLIIKIPRGTLVFKNDKFFADLKDIYEKILVVKGGRGGRGNFSFKTNRRTIPRIAERGEFGEIAKVKLELRIIADIGFIGLPNAGKSTLLSKISAATPKIASYPFTTLVPNLGVVKCDYRKKKHLIVADIPGIVKDAHKGKGLGLEFLRHIERTKVLVHIIDATGFGDKNLNESYRIVNDELQKYSKSISKKPVIVVLNKIDLCDSQKYIKRFKKYLKNKKVFEISAITDNNFDILINEMLKMLEKSSVTDSDEKIYTNVVSVRKYVYEPEFKINVVNGNFVITGTKIESLTNMTRFDEDEALMRYQNILKKIGLKNELKKAGAVTGDTVKIGSFEFTLKE
ncbi:MAG: GTPase ObgE [Endomicrobium sp.]|nr:GTPase ObgE [Endomicrobium sp.]